MADTRTVTVSIGRNVGTEPMDDDRWTAFKSDTLDALAFTGFDIRFQGVGVGYYEGNFEASYTIVATVEPRLLAGLYHVLARLAKDYDQDSIALTTGNTAFPGSES